MKIIIDTKNNNSRQMLEQYMPIVSRMFKKIKTLYPRIKLPKQLILRPIKNKKVRIYCTFGKAEYMDKNYRIAIRTSINSDIFKKDVLAEEVAHISSSLLEKKWGHTKLWRQIYEILKNEKGYFNYNITEIMISVITWSWVLFIILKFLKHIL